ncbi:hypothetical protein PHMEG_0007577, partial [Phytophthora megakarya]
NEQHRLRQVNATAVEREACLMKCRAKDQSRRERRNLCVQEKLNEIGDHSLKCTAITDDEIRFGGRFNVLRMTHGSLNLLLMLECQPNRFEFGGEASTGDDDYQTCKRIETLFDDYPKPVDIVACQPLARELDSKSVDIWVCTPCGWRLKGGLDYI